MKSKNVFKTQNIDKMAQLQNFIDYDWFHFLLNLLIHLTTCNYRFVFTILLFKMDQNNENGILFKLTIKQSIAWLKFKFFA